MIYRAQIAFARHAATASNESGILQGSTDPSLSALGRAQASRMVAWCKSRKVSRIVSSPARRAVETGEIIAAALRVDVEVSECLRERDYGPFEGLTRPALLRARASRGLSAVDPTQHWRGCTEVEQDESIWTRVQPRIAQTMGLQDESLSLLISHAGVLKAVLHATLGIDPARPSAFKFPNGVLLTMRMHEDVYELLELCPEATRVTEPLT